VRLTDKERLTIDEFSNWLVQPDTGTWIYYTGDLTTDAFARDFPNAIRSLAWAAMEKGRVRLFQRRRTLGVFDYLAIKRYGRAVALPVTAPPLAQSGAAVPTGTHQGDQMVPAAI
jgi:hypothetical protein